MGKNEFGNLIFQLPAPVPTLAKKYMATKEEAITLYKAFKRGHWFTRVSDQVFELRREKVEFFEDIMKLAKEYIPISPLRNNKRSHQDSVLNESDDEREQKVLKVSTYDHSMKLKVSFPNQLGEVRILNFVQHN